MVTNTQRPDREDSNVTEESHSSALPSSHIQEEEVTETPNSQQAVTTDDDAFFAEHHQQVDAAESEPMHSVEHPESTVDMFEMGDHVYQWCSFVGIPAVFQHHGIVLGVQQLLDGEVMLTIADFSHFTPGNDSNKMAPKTLCAASSSMTRSCIRTYECSAKGWHKVAYGRGTNGFLKSHFFSRSGTCTTAESSPPGLVRARLEFLLQHPDVLPAYHAVRSNCECVAVWCKTGTWGTLQATSWLSMTAAGQAKQTATIASVAAATQVTVPASGLWGWLGYTTQVSLFSTQPLLIPAIAAYGVVTVGVPLISLWSAQKRWKALTIQLNTSFWEAAIDQPDVFVECITEWSAQSSSVASPEK